MSENEAAAINSAEIPAGKPSGPRVPRSIRFSESEWTGIANEARARGMMVAEWVRYAPVGLSAGKLAPTSPQFPPEFAAQIERLCRGIYLLSKLKRDELVRDGRQEELDRIVKAAIESQASIHKDLGKRSDTAL